MRSSRTQFVTLLVFLAALALLVSNGFAARIFAGEEQVDVYESISPIGVVLDEILRNYVEDPDVDNVVEGALTGMMNSLDDHSSYIPPDVLNRLKDETEGQFEGIGVSIQLDDNGNIMIFAPIEGAPAAKAGIMAGDIIYKIDGTSTKGMAIDEAADLIRGPIGTMVHLTLVRRFEGEDKEPELLEFDIKRGKIPLVSISESRLLDGGIGYVRVADFKKHTAEELADEIQKLLDQGMRAMVLDLRWNPGGLLNASQEVCELFLKKGTLVTYTRGRVQKDGSTPEDMPLYTTRQPALPETVPLAVLVNEFSASSSEIVTGALQFHERALIVGQKTYGKGSVQTIIPLPRPAGAALRLTTALYYTPADVTIHKNGILPDVEVEMTMSDSGKLLLQMRKSYAEGPDMRDQQNHGTVTGNEAGEETVEDVQLQKAVEILKEDTVFERLIERYHRDVKETQVAATDGPKDEVENPIEEMTGALQ